MGGNCHVDKIQQQKSACLDYDFNNVLCREYKSVITMMNRRIVSTATLTMYHKPMLKK